MEILHQQQLINEEINQCHNLITIQQQFPEDLLGLPILEFSKTLIYEVWYEYIKHKYENNTELCYMDTDSFVHSQTEDFYKDIPDDVKKKI